MRPFYLFLLLLSFTPFAYAQESSDIQPKTINYANETQKTYLSAFTTGTEFCEKFKAVTGSEKGFQVSVPVDYSDSSKGTTEIHAFWAEGFYDPNLPTFIFFDGGPGGNSHGIQRISKSYNQLHFDQRGIGCSRPASLDLYRNANFYSSLNNARDAEMIRQHLKISQLTVYGVSYGTVPATIYANLYPQNTTAAVLEGVLYSAETDESSRFLNFYLKRIYKKLPEATKEAMKIYFNSEERASGIENLARMLMYEDGGLEKLDQYLRYIFPDKEKINREIADQVFASDLAESTFFDNENVEGVDVINYLVINCRENRVKNNMTSRFIFNDNTSEEFKLATSTSEYDKECSPLNFAEDQTPYSANKYPIRVPVTYFQGTWDGATYPEGAVRHFKHVAKGTAQLFLAKMGGHTPNLSAILSEADDEEEKSTEEIAKVARIREQQTIITNKALSGQSITEDDVQMLNQESNDVIWLRVIKK